MAPTPRTKPGTSRLSDLARHVSIPTGIATTGWPSVREKCREIGLGFDPWQDGAGRIILSKRADGKFACAIGGVTLSLPRQVGKTYLIGAIVFAICLLYPNTLVIWTAHRERTAGETFRSMQGMARRKKIRPLIGDIDNPRDKGVRQANGERGITFKNGSRILFGARERGFGRGFAKVDLLIFDEAQILTDAAIDDMVPATNVSPMGLVFYMGTPPKPSDSSEVFTRKRRKAIAGELTDGAYIELGADPDADPLDRDQWRKANPTYPHRTSDDAMLRMIDSLSADSVMREMLGIWDATNGDGIFPAWASLASGEPREAETLGIAADVDKAWLSLSAASGDFIGSVMRIPSNEGRKFFISEVVRIAGKRRLPVALQVRGPAWDLKDELEDQGVWVVPVTLDEFVESCAETKDAAETDVLRHGNHDDLNAAHSLSAWRKVGDRLVISRKNGDISALEAAICARRLVISKPRYPIAQSIF